MKAGSFVRCNLKWLIMAVAGFVAKLLYASIHGQVVPVLCGIAVVAATGAVAGGLGGALGVRLAWFRGLRLSPRRGSRQGAFLAAIFVALYPVSPVLRYPDDGAFLMYFAVVLGFLVGLVSPGANPAMLAFAQAHRRLRKGNVEGARDAIREYVDHLEMDPDGEIRGPIAQRFLHEEGASLDVPVELEAAAPPEGRGTEPEAAASPAGRGTELEGAPHGRP